MKAWPPLLPRPAPLPTPCQEMLALKDICERLMALPGALRSSNDITGLKAQNTCHLTLVGVEFRLAPHKRK